MSRKRNLVGEYFRVGFALFVITVFPWFSGCQPNCDTVYLKWIDLNHHLATTLDEPMTAEIKQQRLNIIDRQIKEVREKFYSSKYTDEQRALAEETHGKKMQGSLARIQRMYSKAQ